MQVVIMEIETKSYGFFIVVAELRFLGSNPEEELQTRTQDITEPNITPSHTRPGPNKDHLVTT